MEVITIKIISGIGIGLIITGSILSVGWNCSYGTIFIILLGLVFASVSILQKFHTEKMKTSKFIFKMLIGVLFISFLSIELLIFQAINYEVNTDFDYAIVLGAGTVADKPSLILKRRLDKALECLSNNENLKVIVAGGQGKGKDFAESFVMKKYLIDNGIAEQRIIEENKSTTTNENLQNSKNILNNIAPNTNNIGIITSDFHSFRAKILGEKYFKEVSVCSAESPTLVKINYAIREYLATIKMIILGSVQDQ